MEQILRPLAQPVFVYIGMKDIISVIRQIEAAMIVHQLRLHSAAAHAHDFLRRAAALRKPDFNAPQLALVCGYFLPHQFVVFLKRHIGIHLFKFRNRKPLIAHGADAHQFANVVNIVIPHGRIRWRRRTNQPRLFIVANRFAGNAEEFRYFSNFIILHFS